VVIDERTYTLRPGAVPEYFRRYEEEGLAIQVPILGNLIGYFSTEAGTLNQVVHLWGYADLADRAERRSRLAADERWRAYLETIYPLIVTMENRLLIPAPFSPIR
jgi:NIPSNAP protein